MLITWIEASHLRRDSLEFLTWVDADNITHPYLAESWSPSDDLKTWTFNLRQDVKWSNGDTFNVEDVQHNNQRRIAADSKPVNRTAVTDITTSAKIPDFQFRQATQPPTHHGKPA